MAYPFTEDHDMIREAARGFLQDWYDGGKGPERVYQAGQGTDVQAWQDFAGEQGMAGIAIDEKFGGAGLGDLGRVVIMEELGASLCAIPFLTTCGIVSDILTTFGTDDVKDNLLSLIARGDMTATYTDGHDTLTESGGKLSGKVSGVVDAACSNFIFMSRRKGKAIEIFGIPREAKGLTVTPHKTLDPTRSFSDIVIEDLSLDDVQIVGEGTLKQLDAVVKTSFIALAAECVGGTQACLDMTLEYAGQRVQFDRPIASFQAVKHRCADMFVQIEGARSAVYYAATAEPGEKISAALIAKAYATDAFFKVAGDAIQLHGGIGFTWEYPLHFFFKRARANRSMFGSSSRDYSRLADNIFGDAA